MSIATIRQEILDDSHSLVSATTVDRKIVSAMRFHRDKKLWFSDRKFKFQLVEGQGSYTPGASPLMEKVAEIVGKVVWVLIGGSEDQRWPVSRVTRNEFEYYKQGGTSKSQPDIWDFHAGQLHLYPTPSSSTDLLEGYFVSDIGVPVLKYESGAYKFYAPDGVRLLTATEVDNFSNDWTSPQGAGHMIRARASYLLYRDNLSDPDRAQDWLTTWLEHVAQLEDETDMKTTGAVEIEGCILD